MLGPILETGGFEAVGHLAGMVWSIKSYATVGGQGMPPEQRQEDPWQQLSEDPTQRWDSRHSKQPRRQPDFRHRKPRAALWLDSWHNTARVDSQLATWEARMQRLHMPVSTSVEGQGTGGRLGGQEGAQEGHLGIGMCRKLCDHGQISCAVDALSLLVQRGWHVPKNLYYVFLNRCIAHKDLLLGRRIHSLTVESGYVGDAFLATHLIGLYASHGRLNEAMRVFTKVAMPTAYNWATIIFAFTRYGEAPQAIRLYRQMCESTVNPSNNRIFVAVLKACSIARDLLAGMEVHSHILASPVKPDIFVHTGLVVMYAKCGSLDNALRVFYTLRERDVVSWTAMIAGYAQQGMGHEALSLYNSMQQEGHTLPDTVTYVCLLQACAIVGVGAMHQGRQLHAQIEGRGLQADVLLCGSLVNMYAKCSSLEDARNVFDRLAHRNVGAWNAMLSGYAQQGMGQEALCLYNTMKAEGIVSPNSVTFVCLLQACAIVGVAALPLGKNFHAQIQERRLQANVVLGNSLVNMYVKCGSLEGARIVFDTLPERDVVTWTALIAGYAQQGMGQEALSLYRSMQQHGIATPNSVTFVCLLQACSIVADLILGKQLHAQIEELGLQGEMGVGAALVNMYAKCGSMFDAQQVFQTLLDKTIEAWNALIGGYSCQGKIKVVFDLLHKMRLEGIQPNGITFLSVLTACSHVGLVDQGRKVFEAMRSDYGILPNVGHYTCMMGLLGRAGHLNEALQMAKTMPFPPDGAVWQTLLGACQKWCNVEIGQQAFEFAVTADGKDATPYVSMSNIYASADMWAAAEEVQARRLKFGARKKPGQSWWTDMAGVVHTFVVADKNHHESDVSIQVRNNLHHDEALKYSAPSLSVLDRSDSTIQRESIDLCSHGRIRHYTLQTKALKLAFQVF